MNRILIALAVSTCCACAFAKQPPVPDFTAGAKLEKNAHHDWNLGPIGARGWVYAWKGGSTDSRQILITQVSSDSPAHEKLQTGDVIVGLNSGKFTSDARIAFAKAITAAEAADGKLNIQRWRKGELETVTITIDTPGSYSATAPYNCKKSDWILQKGCQAIANQLQNPDKRRRHPIERSLNTLALLASGEEKYLPLVKKEIEWAKTWEVREDDLHSWGAGWINLLLGEYALATGDDSVLPAINKLSYEIANGQSLVGTWGHRFAYEHNGILRGYGAMNQVGLSLTTSLIIAREAGVDYPKVAEAIEKSQKFLGFYANRGAIPYGDHHPWLKLHDDNGKASAAAVMFDLLGNREATEFFSKTGTASYGVERETGHTGNFFNMLWALPGISRSGPEATGAWINESAWLLDLARKHDGTFEFQGKPAATGGEHSFRGWDCTGAYLLGYALGRKNTKLTGSQKSIAPTLNKKQAKQIIEAGLGWVPVANADSYQQRSTSQLLANLESWSPVVRNRAAVALATKVDSDKSIVPAVVKLTKSPDLNTQLGACEAIEMIGVKATEAVPAIRKLLAAEDFWLQVQAAEALAGIGKPAREAIPDLLQLLAQESHSDDHRDYRQRYVAFALFDRRKGLIGGNLDSVNRDQLRAAAIAVLKNEDGRARGSLQSIYQLLSKDEIEPLLPAIYEAVANQSPSGVMFSDGIRLAGLQILARHKIQEGLPLCIELIETGRWGSARRVPTCLRCLKSYQAAASQIIPQIKELSQQIYSNPKFNLAKPKARNHNAKMAELYKELTELVEKLEKQSNQSKPLVPISQFQ